MAESSGQQYLVRDPQGNVYGPANAALLREWAAQGRIVAGMHMAPRETGEWVEVSVHPELAGCFATPVAGPAAMEPAVTPMPAREEAPVMPGVAPGAAPVTPMEPDVAASYVPPENSQATVSLIAGIVATAGSPLACLCGCVGGPVVLAASVTAIITGIVALNQIKGDPLQGGRGKAVAGIALGIGGLILALAGVAAMVLVMSHK